jgi:hypothetical protein
LQDKAANEEETLPKRKNQRPFLEKEGKKKWTDPPAHLTIPIAGPGEGWQNMHLASSILNYVLQAAILLSIFFYAPMAQNWKRAVMVPATLTFVWGILRTVSIMAFRESDVPLAGFLVAPFLSALYGLLVRLAKVLLCEMSLIRRWETTLKTKFRRWSQSWWGLPVAYAMDG